MDWKIFFTTFGAIFLAELADKTQLVGIGMTAKTGKPLSVLLGSICAYIIVTSISVIVGAILSRHIKPDILRCCGASAFVLIGMLMFWGKL